MAQTDDVLVFEPLYMERVWGGRRLERVLGRTLPPDAVIGEAWELVDRPEAQSVVASGPRAGAALGELWSGSDRPAVFGARAARSSAERFPLLVKVLDCEDTLSVQVHPPASVAASLGGEPKTEMWVIVDATPDAHLFAGVRPGVTQASFEAALRAGEDVSTLLHRIDSEAGDVMFLPSGRVHAIGGGNLIVEIQQNSDTTYRVYDFGRPGLDGKPRELHVEQSLKSIDWDDTDPALVTPQGETLVSCPEFDVERWALAAPRRATDEGECAVICCLIGEVEVGNATLGVGSFALVPANSGDVTVSPVGDAAVVLRVSLPE